MNKNTNHKSNTNHTPNSYKFINADELIDLISNYSLHIKGLRFSKSLIEETINSYRNNIISLIETFSQPITNLYALYNYNNWNNLILDPTNLPDTSDTSKYICIFKNKYNQYLSDAKLYYDNYEECFVARNEETDETLYEVTEWRYIDERNR